MPPPLRCRVSPSGELLLRYSRGEIDLPGIWSKPVVRPRLSLLGRGGKSGDQRINDAEKDLAQLRDAPQAPSTTQSSTSIAVSGRNIVAGYNDSAALSSVSRSMNGYSFSMDGGVTWTDGGGVPSAPGTVSVGDPSVVVNRAGVFYYASMVLDYNGPDGGRAVIAVSRSTNGGRTFGNPVTVNAGSLPLNTSRQQASDVVQSLSDKEEIAVDTSGGPRDGTLYVAWNQYISTTYSNAVRSTTSRIMMAHSHDGGASWSAAVPVSTLHYQTEYYGYSSGSYVSGAAPAVGPSGEVYCAWEETQAATPTGTQYISRSDDGGATFALSSQMVAAVNRIGNATEGVLAGGPRTNEFPSVGVDGHTGVVYMAYASAPTMFPGDATIPCSSDRSNVYLIRSLDQGRTWSGPLRLNDDKTLNDQFFPALTVTAAGVIGVAWYDRRNDPYNQRFDVYLAQSRDGGKTFGANRRVNTVASPLPQVNPNFDPMIAANYMGDYIGIATDGLSFHIAWGDNRDVLNSTSYGPRPDPDIYYASSAVAGR
ncbi:MAG TPA: sialidase family protein [Armatimonadota bacterium]